MALEGRHIDYDRGVIIKIHQQTGMDVFMYADEPGVFRNAFGTEIDASIAKEAGFDTDRLVKEKVKRERLAEAARSIEQELALADDEGKKDVVSERNGFKVIDVGLGRHFVEDPDGNRLTLHALPLEQAKGLLEKLVPKGIKKAPLAEKKEQVHDRI